jgi:hypothetical protein
MDKLDAASNIAREGWQGVIRGIGCVAASVAIAWHDPDVARYALGVIALVASPALARAIIAPRLASLLRKETEQ